MAEIVAALTLLIGAPVQVTCHHNLGGNAGLWQWHGEIQLLKRDCKTLRKIWYRRPVRLKRQAWAVYVLSHELQHHQGVYSEQDATCNGLAQTKRVARAIGARHPFRLRRMAILHNQQWFTGQYRCKAFFTRKRPPSGG